MGAHFSGAPELNRELQKQCWQLYGQTGDSFSAWKGMTLRLTTDAKLRKCDRTLSLLRECIGEGSGFSGFLRALEAGGTRKYYEASILFGGLGGLYSPGLQFLFDKAYSDIFFDLYDNGLSDLRRKTVEERARLLDTVYSPILSTFAGEIEEIQAKVRKKLPQKS